MSIPTFYRRRLPHLTPRTGRFFTTSLLYGALPKAFLDKWEHQEQLETNERARRWFRFLEKGLEEDPKGSRWLADPVVAQIVFDAILFRHNAVYALECFTLMHNHIHMLFSTKADGETASPPLKTIMKSLKGITAKLANQHLQRSGEFWQHEGFDRLVRTDEEWIRTLGYILNNPVQAGLVGHWREWPWSWCREDLVCHAPP